MGYILPVPHHQYNDYQRRVSMDKHDPIHIEKPFRPILESQYYDIANEYTFNSGIMKQQDPKITPTALTTEKMYAALTGKGQHFSDLV